MIRFPILPVGIVNSEGDGHPIWIGDPEARRNSSAQSPQPGNRLALNCIREWPLARPLPGSGGWIPETMEGPKGVCQGDCPEEGPPYPSRAGGTTSDGWNGG